VEAIKTLFSGFDVALRALAAPNAATHFCKRLKKELRQRLASSTQPFRYDV
jgi:hypothetical protein